MTKVKSNWDLLPEDKEEFTVVKKGCINCKHQKKELNDIPCSICENNSEWESRDGK